MLKQFLIEVIPIHWVEEETFKFCFDGIESFLLYALGTAGCVKDSILECIICYGSEIGYDFNDVPVKKFEPTGRFIEGEV